MTKWADRTEKQKAQNRERCRRFYEKNRENLKEYSRNWYAENKERSLENRRRYANSARGRAVALFNRISKQAKNGRRFNRPGFDFDVTVEWIQERIELGFCETTGILFELIERNKKWSPFSPSVDRIDCTKGYTKDNSRVVCLIFNLSRNQFTDEDVLKMARAMVKKHE